ncbi:MAG: glutamate racemase [Candidatus Nomurabacteria bacterium]|nr:MAG: glutamate racemase [Candidatus Nomurabacteria bacterium]
MKIGFFDSGLGGLTILKSVARELSEYEYVYYGDTANLPYGDKTEEEIYRLTVEGVRYLYRNDCVLVIIACNTASAETVRRLQVELLPTEYPDRKLLGVIVPTIELLEFSQPTKVALLATKRTIESKKYPRELDSKGNGNVILIEVSTPELVPLIEAGNNDEATRRAISRIEAEAGDSEVVVLGCTHYTQISYSLREYFRETKVIIAQDEVIPKKLESYLFNHPEITSRLTRGEERKIYLTKHRPDYDRLIGQFLGGVYLDKETEIGRDLNSLM